MKKPMSLSLGVALLAGAGLGLSSYADGGAFTIRNPERMADIDHTVARGKHPGQRRKAKKDRSAIKKARKQKHRR